MRIKNIYFDLDGVFTLWNRAVLKLSGYTDQMIHELNEVWSVDVVYIEDAVEQTGFPPVVPRNSYWNNREFWATLEPSPWIEELRTLMRDLKVAGYEVYFLSSPGSSPEAYAGKIDWLKSNGFSSWLDRVILTKAKDAVAKTSEDLLIDDFQKNIDAVKSAGGNGLLFPAPWNKNRDLHPLGYIQDLRFTLVKSGKVRASSSTG